MTQEDKNLLLKDLCSRLPYGVKCEDITLDFVGTMTDISMHDNMCKLYNDYGDNYTCFMANCKPYLFPLSSMTEEQKEIYCNLQDKVIYNSKGVTSKDLSALTKWLDKNMFDWRGLIPKGLAIDATGKNIY